MTQPTSCQSFRLDMVPDPVEISVAGAMSREKIMPLALARARQIHPEVMLLAWFERTTGEYSPRVPC